ncbi:hypothetical protein E2C01_071959 [Portunus trituberculatus]|uniref:Uncharacterized protein n=1 Tax=Portunus trituberculatus TaxID=210409 RepID=A0A5B7I1A6_PORTR|nr:hypothetical protein [Portunus trituberculatus]
MTNEDVRARLSHCDVFDSPFPLSVVVRGTPGDASGQEVVLKGVLIPSVRTGSLAKALIDWNLVFDLRLSEYSYISRTPTFIPPGATRSLARRCKSTLVRRQSRARVFHRRGHVKRTVRRQ